MASELQNVYGNGDAVRRSSSSHDTRAQSRREEPLVLVVDDDDNTREAMQTLLELDGYRVAAAGDGQEALDLLEHGLRPGLILLDLNMPRMDGATFRQAQRRHPGWANIPVIVCSGSLGHDNRAALGAVVFLRKPMVVDNLMKVVHQQCPR